MAFCPNCGTQIPTGAAACPNCAGGGQSAGTPTPTTAVAAPAGLTDNLAGALAYVTIIPAILFLVLEPYNRKKFIRFHSFQCIFLALAWFVLAIVVGIVTVVLAFIPILGHIAIGLLWTVLHLGTLVLIIILALKAYQGEMFKLPVIGDLAEKQAGA